MSLSQEIIETLIMSVSFISLSAQVLVVSFILRFNLFSAKPSFMTNKSRSLD